jgi:hypothetical protein
MRWVTQADGLQCVRHEDARHAFGEDLAFTLTVRVLGINGTEDRRKESASSPSQMVDLAFMSFGGFI